jgi:uncharacterized protein (DUF1015 family)
MVKIRPFTGHLGNVQHL